MGSGGGWLTTWGTELPAPHRLVFFPYAGGSASTFRRWASAFGPAVDFYCVQYPGRGHRLAETPLRRLTDLVDAVTPLVWDGDSRPCTFWGHSMGALLAFEVARRLRARGQAGPIALVVSGRRAPQLLRPLDPVHVLGDEAFIDELRRLEGTPREVLEHAELMQLLLPALRADFEVCETYRYEPGAPLPCPITALAGEDDKDTAPDEIAAWREQTQGGFTLHRFAGGHFFLHSASRQVLAVLRAQLDAVRLMPHPPRGCGAGTSP
jgi:medium-chain acyl-[acyl-carrier-protein] hydrolase